ncbi:MAG: hypothetical protein ACRDF8_11115, partial [Chloroflexota bacterium]
MRDDADGVRVRGGRRDRAAMAGGRRYAPVRPRRRAPHPGGAGGQGTPPVDADTRWLAEHPRPAHRLLWPFYVAMALAWLMWGAALLLAHLGVC